MSRNLLTCLFGLLAVCSTQGWFFFDKESDCVFEPEGSCGDLTEFYLYTQELAEPVSLTLGDTDQLIRGHVKRGLDTKIISHGYTDEADEGWAVNMALEMLKHDDVNVIAVNWEQSADNLNYFQAAANTRAVGERVAAMILQISEKTHNPLKSFHLIGHSLGSHVSGFAGKAVKRATNDLVGRITGLDPAGPCFRKSHPANRLCAGDAEYVDAIHSDAQPLWQLGFGTKTLMATVDFFPNGGKDQPGCPDNAVDFVKDFFKTGKVTKGFCCSHTRAVELFHESINPANKFLTCPCPIQKSFDDTDCMKCSAEDSVQMGYYSTPPKSVKPGYVYTTPTTKTSPFYDSKAITVY